jgi:ribonucleotide monophosphatase NagD (HAD superfamily)
MCRFGHGCFMHCVESLYKKITGYELKYTALVGKPSEITYHYAERILQFEARKMKLPVIRRMYCIG